MSPRKAMALLLVEDVVAGPVTRVERDAVAGTPGLDGAESVCLVELDPRLGHDEPLAVVRREDERGDGLAENLTVHGVRRWGGVSDFEQWTLLVWGSL